MKFPERLNELRKENKLTQRDLAYQLGLTANCICEWEKGRSEPSSESLIKLSNIFAVSVDYLLGRTDDLGYITISNAPAFELTEHEKNVISLYRKLKPHTQSYVYGIMQNMVISG